MKSKDKNILRVLVINPGSTSTKIALFNNEKCVAQEDVRHDADSFKQIATLAGQAPVREQAILKFIKKHRVKTEKLNAISARGGLLAPCQSGTYLVEKPMLEELASNKHGTHACNLGAALASRLAEKTNIPAFIVDPVVVDEFCDDARFSGLPEITRKSRWHALNQKSVARIVAKKLGKRYENLNLIVAHIGGGTTVAAHMRGRAIDANNGLNGDGPFSIERSGGLPTGDLVKLARTLPDAEIWRKLTGSGGMVAYLGTNDMREVHRRIKRGDKMAAAVLSAMAYQVAKEIGACAAVLSGKVDAIVLSGGAAHSKLLVSKIKRRVKFIAPVHVLPGESEMAALAQGALRVLRGETRPHHYVPAE